MASRIPDVFTAKWTIDNSGSVSVPKNGIQVNRWDGHFPSPQEFPCQVVPYTVVALHENVIRNHVLIMNGQEVRRGHIQPGAVQIVPAGQMASGRCSAGAYHFNHLQIPSQALAQKAYDLELLDWELLDPHYDRLDFLLVDVVAQLSRVLLTQERIDALYAEELSDAVLAHLLRFYSPRPIPSIRSGGLSGQKAKLLLSFITDNLSGSFSMGDLARQVDFSTSHLRCAFRQTFGVAPSAFILRKRLAAARKEILRSDKTIAEIATHWGFADAQHFTKRFSAVFGQTPGSLRKR